MRSALLGRDFRRVIGMWRLSPCRNLNFQASFVPVVALQHSSKSCSHKHLLTPIPSVAVAFTFQYSFFLIVCHLTEPALQHLCANSVATTSHRHNSPARHNAQLLPTPYLQQCLSSARRAHSLSPPQMANYPQ